METYDDLFSSKKSCAAVSRPFGNKLLSFRNCKQNLSVFCSNSPLRRKTEYTMERLENISISMWRCWWRHFLSSNINNPYHRGGCDLGTYQINVQLILHPITTTHPFRLDNFPQHTLCLVDQKKFIYSRLISVHVRRVQRIRITFRTLLSSILWYVRFFQRILVITTTPMRFIYLLFR